MNVAHWNTALPGQESIATSTEEVQRDEAVSLEPTPNLSKITDMSGDSFSSASCELKFKILFLIQTTKNEGSEK